MLQLLIILCSPAALLCETTCPRNWNTAASSVCSIDDDTFTDLETSDVEQGLSLLQRSARVNAATSKPAALSRRHKASDQEVEDIISRLWNGEDVTEVELHTIKGPLPGFTRSLKRGTWWVDDALHSAEKMTKSMGHIKRLHVLGPPDTGTNLLVQTLGMNFHDRMLAVCNDPHGTSCDTSVWKHSISSKDDLYTRFLTCQEQLCKTKGTQRIGAELLYNKNEAAVIIMVRSPISQMVSWRDKPYSLTPCFHRGRPWNQALSPCFANTSPEWHDVVKGCKVSVKFNKSLIFDTAVDVYNTYIRQYLALKHDQRIGPVILVNYEELVVDPGSVLDRIATALDWPLKQHWQILEQDAKRWMGGSTSRGRSAAIEKITGRAFLKGLGKQDLALLCSGLNKSLLTGFYENVNSAKNKSYLYDC